MKFLKLCSYYQTLMILRSQKGLGSEHCILDVLAYVHLQQVIVAKGIILLQENIKLYYVAIPLLEIYYRTRPTT